MIPRRTHAISRLEGYSDAAFASALTLLVVSLDSPRSYSDLMQLALVLAIVLPVRLAFLSPTCFVLMGPAHWTYGTYLGRRRRTVAAQVALS